jgi:hypothetical protein
LCIHPATPAHPSWMSNRNSAVNGFASVDVWLPGSPTAGDAA